MFVEYAYVGGRGTPLSDLETAARTFLAREERSVDLKRFRALIDALEGDFALQTREVRKVGGHLGRGAATVVGFIGPEYLYDGKQIIRAGLEDHFCGKLLGLPMGCDVCYTNHAEADQDDMDTLLTLLAVAGCNYFMGVPGADDIMLNYQSTSFHDSHYLRQVLGLRPAPEFEAWLDQMQIAREGTRLLPINPKHRLIEDRNS